MMNIEDVLKGHGIGGGGSNIKSIQVGSVVVGATQTVDVTIAAVDLSKAILQFGKSDSYNASTGYSNGYAVMGKLTTATNINFRKTSSTGDITIYWQVIEFNNVKSIQRGDASITADNTDFNITISDVNVNKSIVYTSGLNNISALTASGINNAGRLTSPTNLAVRAARTSYSVIHWQVIEFK